MDESVKRPEVGSVAMAAAVRVRVGVELIALALFLWGFFAGVTWAMLAGGGTLVLMDIALVAMGAMDPLIIVILGVVLAFLIEPWYAGVFWATAVFNLLALPGTVKQFVSPPEGA